MSFYPPGSGSGSSSIASSADVALNNPSNAQVLIYDSSVNKWRNRVLTPSDIAGLESYVNALIAAVMNSSANS